MKTFVVSAAFDYYSPKFHAMEVKANSEKGAVGLYVDTKPYRWFDNMIISCKEKPVAKH